jgi:hypothetical protein
MASGAEDEVEKNAHPPQQRLTLLIMQRLSHCLPRLSKTGFFSSISPLNVAAKFPIPSSSLGVTARFMSSESRPTSDHITEAVVKQVKTPLKTAFTPEQKWADRSKKAMEDAISSPPADAYAGKLLSLMLTLTF